MKRTSFAVRSVISLGLILGSGCASQSVAVPSGAALSTARERREVGCGDTLC